MTPAISVVRAPNPGPLTLDGTNTWILGDPALAPPIVVDPGPAQPGHLDRVRQACRGRVSTIVLTHRHADHAASAPALAARTASPVRAADQALRIGSDGLADGDTMTAAGVEITVVATPGHTSDSVSLLLTGSDGVRLLTGDTVLGRGTSVIAAPDGDLGAYLDSLDRLRLLADEHGVRQLLPGHGPVVDQPLAVLDGYRQHRRARLEQVRAALRAGDRTPAEVVARVYGHLGPELWPAAEQTVRAQLAHLQRRSELS